VYRETRPVASYLSSRPTMEVDSPALILRRFTGLPEFIFASGVLISLCVAIESTEGGASSDVAVTCCELSFNISTATQDMRVMREDFLPIEQSGKGVKLSLGMFSKS
jgi:hypothetical protein